MKQARVNKIGKKSRTKANKSSKTQEKNPKFKNQIGIQQTRQRENPTGKHWR